MGFADKLRENLANLNPNDPLFGGLIPRRVLEEPEVRQGRMSASAPARNVVRRNGVDIDNSNNQSVKPEFDRSKLFPYAEKPKIPENMIFDWGGQQIDQRNRALELESKRFGLEREKFGLEGDKFRHEVGKDYADLDLKRDAAEINHRKQALDEWKTQNPDGKIQIAEDGTVHLINPITGQTMNTGLKADHFSDKDKLKLGHENALKLEQIRQKGRMDVEKLRQNRGDNISPSQQRVATDDAFNELKIDPAYADLVGKYIDKDTGAITQPESSKGFFGWGATTDEQVNDITQRLADFQTQLKKKADTIMNKRINSLPLGDDNDTEQDNGDMVEMIDPDGRLLHVPADKVEEVKAMGAKIPGEEPTQQKKPIQVDDSVELMYNDAGKVIGARNRKPSK